MAPTLKAVDAVVSTAAAPSAATAAAVEISIESTSCRVPNDNHAAATAAPLRATVLPLSLPSPPLQMQQSTKPLTIARENPNDIPPDESAFLIEPHFSRHNPFHRNLSNLDLAMRCAICSELYHAPVTLVPCMHAFCSLCVRNHLKSTLTGMKRKVDCPKCNEPVRMPGSSDYEKGILPNKQLEQLVDAYTLCRDQIRENLVRLDLLEKEKALGEVAATSKKVWKHDEVLTKDHEIRSSKRIRRTVKKADHSSDTDFDDDDDARVYVDQRNLKIPARTLTQGQHQLKRKPTVNYHSLKKKQLVELCQKEGLSTHGNDTELKKRHSDFITLYNSECDSAHPRSVKELLAEIRNRESSIRKEAERAGTGYQSALMRNLTFSLESRREGDSTMPTSRDATFDSKLNNNFAEMITSLKKQREAAFTSKSSHPVATTEVLKQLVNKDIFEQVKSIGHDTVIQALSTSRNATFDVTELTDGRVSSSPRPLGTINGVKYVYGDDVESIKSVGRDTSGHNGMPTASPHQLPLVHSSLRADSKIMADTPQLATRQTSNSEQSFATRPEVTMPVVPTPNPKYISFTKPTSASRLSSLGPWVCRECTFNNLRNITKKARCEMCNAVRPVELGSCDRRAVEVVNIEC